MRQAVKRLACELLRHSGVNIKNIVDCAQRFLLWIAHRGFAAPLCRNQEGVTAIAVQLTERARTPPRRAWVKQTCLHCSKTFRAVLRSMAICRSKNYCHRSSLTQRIPTKLLGSGRNAAERMNIGRAIFCRFESTRFCPPPSRRTFVCRLRRHRRPRRRRRFPWAVVRCRQRAACHNFPQPFAVF